ncbi:MAG: bacteriocin [Erysipelotrichaceae bacterium]|nr:bacteriocin [Erysipelotrichaceae bacterium]
MSKDIKQLNDDALKEVTGGDLNGIQATLIAVMVGECKQNNLTLDETIKKITSVFKEKNTDYLEAVGLIYELWQVE